MRFLCLHGMGTNSGVYEAQLAPIRAQLDPSHEFIFVDGLIECEAADGVEGIFPGPFYCYYSKPTPNQLQEAYDLIHEVIEDEGPFDGVFGFSQGGALAASMLLHHHKQTPHAPDLFKLAVFTCASLPFDLDTESQPNPYHTVICPKTGSVSVRDWTPGDHIETTRVNGYVSPPCSKSKEPALRRYHPDREEARILIPTVHVLGELDPFVPQSRALVDLCGKHDASVVTHELGHKLPRDGIFVRKAVSAIQLSISKALHRG